MRRLVLEKQSYWYEGLKKMPYGGQMWHRIGFSGPIRNGCCECPDISSIAKWLRDERIAVDEVKGLPPDIRLRLEILGSC